MKIEEDCGTCNGVGEVPDGRDSDGNQKWKQCGTCHGNGTVTKTV